MVTKIQTEPLRQLHYWIRERQSIAYKRAAGLPPPWTTDPILANNRFCNVRRMDDKVSKWLLDYWYDRGSNRSTMLAATGLARLFNWPDSLDGLRSGKVGRFIKWDMKKADAHFHKIKTDGGKVFTGAYIINGALGGRGSDKIETVLGQIDKMRQQPGILDTRSMKATWSNLQSVDGLGSFMAGQMVADLRHVQAGEWSDSMTFAPLGPGSNRGMAWLYGWNGIDDLPRMRQDEFEAKINELQFTLLKNGGYASLYARLGLELHDTQNCLCEFDKFMRIKSGTGKARNGYRAVMQLPLL